MFNILLICFFFFSGLLIGFDVRLYEHDPIALLFISSSWLFLYSGEHLSNPHESIIAIVLSPGRLKTLCAYRTNTIRSQGELVVCGIHNSKFDGAHKHSPCLIARVQKSCMFINSASYQVNWWLYALNCTYLLWNVRYCQSMQWSVAHML